MPYFQETRLEQSDLIKNALLASRYKAPLGLINQPPVAAPTESNEDSGFSEICLNGAPRQCMQWLAPVLRDLSQTRTPRWLTLIDPPENLSHNWLRSAGLDPSQILIVRPKRSMDCLTFCCEILALGNSHTVVSWLTTGAREANMLEGAARKGNCRSLNVRLDAARAA
ncbi:MAG: SulA-like leucine-rich domain-containing protein [Pseudomonas profundi]|uniref:SulA-like leucine-rich domain-containing protein n=1 Tax=Pseudomonas profundi TaxID=1981513 RepID=UPI0030032D41